MLLKELCTAAGVSGCEDNVRNLITSKLPRKDIRVDAMGNLTVRCGGRGKRIMLAAHMDEVGLIVSGITDNGFLKFKTVGGISTEVLSGKKVLVGSNMIPGIIGIRAVHLQKKEERETPLTEKQLYIDIGAISREDAEGTVNLGDCVSFDTKFTEFGDRLVSAKALDDRAGCAIMIALSENRYNAELCLAFTVQEEVGCRGAQAAAEYFKPDIAIVVESTICTDTFKTEPHQTITNLGGGPVITFMDRASIPDRSVMNSLIKAAEANEIPWQFKRTTMGGTDAGVISRAVEGIPTAVVALPCRNLHSPSTVISLDDYDNTLKLLSAWLRSFSL